MYSFSHLNLFLMFALFFSNLSLAFAHSPQSLTIITEEWPPYNFIENHRLTGFSTEVVKLVMKDLKRNDKMLVLPGPRAMKVLNNPPRAMFYSMIQTKERKPLYKWIGPFAEQSIYFYKKKGSSLKIETLEDAKRVKSICSRGSGLVYSMLKEAGFNNLDTGVSGEGIYLRMINDRCVLAIGESHLGVQHWLKKTKQKSDAVIQTKVKLISSPLYIAASKDITDQEINEWQKSLDKIMKTKAYQILVRKYFN